MTVEMDTVSAQLRRTGETVRVLFHDLICNHASISYRQEMLGELLVINAYGNYVYGELSVEGRRVQSHLLDELGRYQELLAFLLAKQPRDTLDTLATANESLSRTAGLENTHCQDVKEAFEWVSGAIDRQLELVDHLYDRSEGDVLLLPDTNALLYNPHMELWHFKGIGRFVIVLAPTVLAELDEFKGYHRSQSVIDKARSLVKVIKECFRRGDPHVGVPIFKPTITLATLPAEPSASSYLSWMQDRSADDRLLASVLETMRTRPRSTTALVTGDVNLQNKAEYARIPYLEPPEPKATPQ